ncbi:hypothetical protein BLNAU_23935 [Blattamonas nauphoetae]|uniref:Uncharacterized protein n=1 Tax=Blattamonas nauphoetae TaxID=2049346 RepID=A0ABQ9WT11_9EUKA|nr:hypothetical protein BLNAU_23935 [Blattamonas nauphoetae]
MQSDTFSIPICLSQTLMSISDGWMVVGSGRLSINEKKSEIEGTQHHRFVQKLAQILEDTHVYITIQFPYPVLAAQNRQWIDLVGCSGIAVYTFAADGVCTTCSALEEGRVITLPTKKLSDADVDHLRQGYFVGGSLLPAVGEDEELRRSIEETPDWIARDSADVSRFDELVGPALMGDNLYQEIYVHGQPGTGKSQMLLYLIHCLMQLDKVICQYSRFFLIVRTTTTHSQFEAILPPSRDIVHSGFPVIRIVDSIDPSAAQDMAGSFTVAQPRLPPATHSSEVCPQTPRAGRRLSTVDETGVLRDAEVSGDARTGTLDPASVTTIVKLHPLVIRILGAFGCLVDASSYYHSPATASASRTDTHQSVPNGFQLELDLEETELPEGMNPAQSATDQGKGRADLCPKRLGSLADLNNIFNRISDMFGQDGITLDEKRLCSVFVPLIAPTSQSASRLWGAQKQQYSSRFFCSVVMQSQTYCFMIRNRSLENTGTLEIDR